MTRVQQSPEPRVIAGLAAEVTNEYSFAPLRLNHFQRKMLHWDDTHPFNAIHAVRLPQRGRQAALRIAAADACREIGLGELAVARNRRSIRYEPLDTVPVTALPDSAVPEQTLCDVMSAEINRPFPTGPHHPMRWFLFDEADGGAHYVVLVYHHVVADAHSIEALLGAVLCRYLDAPCDAPELRLSLESPQTERWMRRQIWRNGALRAALRAQWLALRVHFAHRLKEDKPGSDHARVVTRSIPPGFFDDLGAACRRAGVGVNDALVAGHACAIAEQTRRAESRGSRSRLALATIQNLRRFAPEDVRGYFGVVLGELIFILRHPDAPFGAVVQQVAAQRRTRTPDQHAAVGTVCSLFAWSLWPMLGIRSTRGSFRKFFPLCGGVSTVVIDESLLGPAAEHISRYVRAIPAGPATPLALAPTVFAGRLELSLSHRPVGRGVGEVTHLLDAMVAALTKFVEDTKTGETVVSGLAAMPDDA